MVTAENMLLDRTSRFKDQFLKDLRQGKISPGELLPARRILAKRYKISPSSVARVVSDLINEKTLATRKGRFGGTYLLVKPELPKKLKKLSFHYSTRTDKTIRSGIFRRWVEQFARENKEYQVQVLPQVFHYQEMETMSPSFISLHESELPSIMPVPLTSLAGLVARKLVHPLVSDPAEAAKEAEVFRPEWHSSLLVDGSLYGYLTEGVTPSLLLYSTERLRRGGVTDAELNGGWKSWLGVMKRLCPDTGGLIIENDGIGMFLLFAHLLREQLGEHWINKPEDWNGVMPSQECLDTLTQLRELQDTVGLTVIDKPVHWKIIEQLSCKGSAAVMTVPSLAGLYYSFIRNPGDLQMGTFPSRTAKKPNLLGNAMAWVLTRPDDREAAMAFLRWAIRPDIWTGQMEMYKKLGKIFAEPPFVPDKELRKQLDSFSPEWFEFQKRIRGFPVSLEPPSSMDFRIGVGRLLLDWLKEGGTPHDGRERLCGLWAAWVEH